MFSPSIDVYSTWLPVKEYIEKEMKVRTGKEEIYFNHYSPESLQNIIDTKHKLMDHMKKENYNKLYSILIIVDDFADAPEFSRQSKLLHSLYTRGRQNSISTTTATQKFTSIHPVIPVNATELYVYRLRNYNDLKAFLEEVSAVADKKVLLEIYHAAAEEPYSFLLVNLRAKNKNDIFHIRFDNRIEIQDDHYM